ncbi:MAG: GGDEF domain-containing protein, partial [Arenimonas sp.]|nr:GGDEF domain-containing protein [Arenimonas sp.]
HELLWPITWSQVMASTYVNLLCLGALVVLPLLATVGFLLMCTERGQEELERTARLDFLTGIFNRRAIEDLASRAISAARRHGTPLAIMILDLDHFKRINDAHGHEVGDRALIETVLRMREAMRAEDLVGRLGGEEFVVVMPDMALASAYAAAERLRRNFSDRPMFISSGSERLEIMLTVSIGVAALEPGDQLFSHLLRRADQAMYAAKAGGRNLVMLDGGPG